MCLCDFFSLSLFCVLVVCACVCVGIQFSVLAALNVSELSCSPSFLPLVFFFLRRLQSPNSLMYCLIFFVFLCARFVDKVSTQNGAPFACIFTGNTGLFFFRLSLYNVFFLCSMRVVCPDFKVEVCAF